MTLYSVIMSSGLRKSKGCEAANPAHPCWLRPLQHLAHCLVLSRCIRKDSPFLQSSKILGVAASEFLSV